MTFPMTRTTGEANPMRIEVAGSVPDKLSERRLRRIEKQIIMLFEIVNGIQQQGRIVPEVTDTCVAVMAEKSSDLS